MEPLYPEVSDRLFRSCRSSVESAQQTGRQGAVRQMLRHINRPGQTETGPEKPNQPQMHQKPNRPQMHANKRKYKHFFFLYLRAFAWICGLSLVFQVNHIRKLGSLYVDKSNRVLLVWAWLGAPPYRVDSPTFRPRRFKTRSRSSVPLFFGVLVIFGLCSLVRWL